MSLLMYNVIIWILKGSTIIILCQINLNVKNIEFYIYIFNYNPKFIYFIYSFLSGFKYLQIYIQFLINGSTKYIYFILDAAIIQSLKTQQLEILFNL